MKYFNCDYNEGAYQGILDRMNETNLCQTIGYGEDEFCEQAREMIRELCEAPDAAVHLMVGGTQTNLTVISAALRAHQGVISPFTGHINVHETGAIEATGHKVLTIDAPDGRLTSDQVDKLCGAHFEHPFHEHSVMPKMVYISNPTELGTLYSRSSLAELRRVCDKYGLYLYLDGARMGYGLMAKENDLDLPFIYQVCDAFYIGGTKQGALFGEALVIRNDELKRDFRYIIKQKGGMFAKGRLLGIQFIELFRNGAYFDLADRADHMADRLRDTFRSKGYELMAESGTNQVFVVLPDEHMKRIMEKYEISYQEPAGENRSLVRFCTSWATRQEDVEELIRDVNSL